MSSVGETLRRERLRAGLDLDKIAQDTKIAKRTLELIETDQFEKLPGGVFARSFVRQYARAVGVDEDEVVRELERTLAPALEPLPTAREIAKQEIRMPRVARWGLLQNRTSSNSSLPSLALVVLVMVVCSLAYTWWQKSQQVRPASTPAPAAATAETAKTAGNPATATAAPTSEAPAATTPESPAVTPAATQESAAGTVHLALTAEEATWVRATANGKVVFSGVIQPNETKSVDVADTVTLRVGNAGGVAITLNGKPIPAIGPKGQVRVVQLTPGGEVQVVPPKPPEPPQADRQSQTL